MRAYVLGLLALAAPLGGAAASQYTVLGSYGPAKAGTPSGGLVPDGAGGLIGVSRGNGGGTSPNGAIVRFSPPARGFVPWTVSVLYSFAGGADGSYPQGKLTADGSGGFYGITFGGGSAGGGTFFHIGPAPGRSALWQHSVLYNFQGGTTDTAGAHGDLVADSLGNLYGSASGNASTAGGPGKYGAVFRLTPPATQGGGWAEAVIAFFAGGTADGRGPLQPVLDPSGTLYVATVSGGAKNFGEIVSLTPTGEGGLWSKAVLHSFTRSNPGVDGQFPGALFESGGVLYGTTKFGGANGGGTFYSLTNSGGTWAETILYNFKATTTDAAEPSGGLYVNEDGSILGDSMKGGAAGFGAIFQLTPSAGSYSESVLQSLGGGAGGSQPYGGLATSSLGGFYGITLHGGAQNKGVLYNFTP